MNVGNLLIGILNIAIVVVILLIVGVIAKYIWEMLVGAVPAQLQKLYLALVALIALVMLAAMLLGSTVPFRVIGASGVTGPACEIDYSRTSACV